jgi:F-type H+-transporting ATPase subunit c
MGFERSYQVKIPSKQINKAAYYTLIAQPKMYPLFFTGFANIGLTYTGVGIGVIFGALILGVAINPSFIEQCRCAILGFVFSELMWTFEPSFLLVVTPVVVYANADSKKLEIFKKNKGKSGIYC